MKPIIVAAALASLSAIPLWGQEVDFPWDRGVFTIENFGVGSDGVWRGRIWTYNPSQSRSVLPMGTFGCKPSGVEALVGATNFDLKYDSVRDLFRGDIELDPADSEVIIVEPLGCGSSKISRITSYDSSVQSWRRIPFDNRLQVGTQVATRVWIAGKEGDATVWHADVRTSCIDEGCRTQLAWFYSPDNIELLIKSLDGCHINGHIWSMVGSATTIRWSIDVYQYNQRLRDWVRPFVGDTLNAEGHMVGSLNLETIPCEGGVSSQWHQDQSDTSDYSIYVPINAPGSPRRMLPFP